MLGLPKTGGIPAESAFGRKRASVDTMRLKVASVIPAEGLGRFGLRPNQRVPRNAYISLGTLQKQLQEPGRVNAIFRPKPTPPTTRPGIRQLADYGIHIEPSPRGYIDITTEQMIFPPAVEQALFEQLGGLDVQPTLTYLANSIACGKLEVPYSTVTAIDFQDQPPLGPFLSTDGKPLPKLGDGQIALNSWAAERLKARVGDSIRVTYFEPESTFGLLHERTVDLKLAAIVKLEGAAADKGLTPTVRGLTDKATIEDWDLPFEIKRGRIKPEDDRYWTRYGATPKAFVSLATGRQLWGSRFGQTTALRIRPAAASHGPDACPAARSRPAAQQFVFRPIKEQALKAAAGTTPFGVLFLGFSFFVIAAAVMLVVLLFRLGIEQRARHVGLLLALGFRPRQITRLLAGEGILVAIAGSLIGTLAGVGYAALMLFGLRTWWLPAIGTPFLTLHVAWQSPVIGLASGLLVAWRPFGLPPAAWAESPRGGCWPERRGRRKGEGGRRKGDAMLGTQYPVLSTQFPVPALSFLLPPSPCSCSLLAPAAILVLVPLGEEAQVGAFFGAGSLALVVAAGAGLFAIPPRRDRAGGSPRARQPASPGASQCGPQPGPQRLGHRTDGLGMFPDCGRERVSHRPRQANCRPQQRQRRLRPHRPERVADLLRSRHAPGRKESGFDPDQEELLAKCRFYAFCVKPGDEASCLNLYQAQQPRMLGVTPEFIHAAASPGPTHRTCPIPGKCSHLTHQKTAGRIMGRYASCSTRRPPATRSIRRSVLASVSRLSMPATARWNCKLPGCWATASSRAIC